MPRPRKSGKRTKSGRLSRAYKHPELRDHGTTEAQAKRAAFINDAAVELAGSALGILLARGHFDQDQYLAGDKYARLHWHVFPRSPVVRPLLEDMPGRSSPMSSSPGRASGSIRCTPG